MPRNYDSWESWFPKKKFNIHFCLDCKWNGLPLSLQRIIFFLVCRRFNKYMCVINLLKPCLSVPWNFGSNFLVMAYWIFFCLCLHGTTCVWYKMTGGFISNSLMKWSFVAFDTYGSWTRRSLIASGIGWSFIILFQ